MRFEVDVEADLEALHRARAAYNERHADDAAIDLPSFVQKMTDQAMAQVLAPLGPTTLAAALTKIAELEAALQAKDRPIQVLPEQLG